MPEVALPQFGRFQALEELGAGAMGTVYLCVDPRLARPVAIKVVREQELSPSERDEYQARFRLEAEAAGRLNHPGIVQIYDVGPTYMVMEYLEGRPLSAVMSEGEALTVAAVCSLVLQVADAIDYAHRQGIVHRDVKPANIMVLDDGGVKVMDFGVARLEGRRLTAVGTVVGSVRYMAPEQMLGETVDGRADVFALAGVTYELLVGEPPFGGRTITDVVTQVVQGRHVPLQERDPRMPGELAAVFARALSRSPGQRHPTAMEFARDVYLASHDVLDFPVFRPPCKEAAEGTFIAPFVNAATTSTRTRLAPFAAPPEPQGVLMLDSDPPGAETWLNGDPVGLAPVTLHLPFGRHAVRMEAGGRSPVVQEVDLRKEQPLATVGFTLPLAGDPASAVQPGQMVRFGPGVVPPVRVEGRCPDYPDSARAKGLEGTAVVDAWIGGEGDVLEVALVQSAGAALDSALLDAVAGWRFRPATLNGTPVSVRLTIQHQFRM